MAMNVVFETLEINDEAIMKWWAEAVNLSGDRLPSTPCELEGWDDVYDVYGCFDSFMEASDLVAMIFDGEDDE